MSGQVYTVVASFMVKQSSLHIGCVAGWLKGLSGYYDKEINLCPFKELNS
jgi:hypothetical protein